MCVAPAEAEPDFEHFRDLAPAKLSTIAADPSAPRATRLAALHTANLFVALESDEYDSVFDYIFGALAECPAALVNLCSVQEE